MKHRPQRGRVNPYDSRACAVIPVEPASAIPAAGRATSPSLFVIPTNRRFRALSVAALFNDVVAKVAARHVVVFVDLHGQAPLRERPELFCADGFHPSGEGYAAIADQLWAAIERGGVVRESA